MLMHIMYNVFLQHKPYVHNMWSGVCLTAYMCASCLACSTTFAYGQKVVYAFFVLYVCVLCNFCIVFCIIKIIIFESEHDVHQSQMIK